MMRSFRGVAVVALLLAASTASVQAQAASGSPFAVQAGVSLPMGSFGDGADMGIQIGGTYSLKAFNQDVRINADWTNYGLDGVDGSISMLGAMANVVRQLGGNNGLYVLGGLGMYRWTVDVAGVSDSEMDLAWNAGIGMTRGKFYVEARYLSILSDGEATNALPIVVGMKF